MPLARMAAQPPPPDGKALVQQNAQCQQQPEAAPEFLELQRLQRQFQFGADATESEHPQQGGAAQGAFQPVTAVAEQHGLQGRGQGRQKGSRC